LENQWPVLLENLWLPAMLEFANFERTKMRQVDIQLDRNKPINTTCVNYLLLEVIKAEEM